jgi:L-asparagine oxygenase
MEPSIKKQIAAYGYAFFQDYCVGMNTIAVAAAIGKPLTPCGAALVQELVPRESGTPNTYSGIYGLNRFPFHTDLAHWRVPPHYLLLRCIKGYADIPTLLLDGQALVEGELLELLSRAIVKPRRPRNGATTLLRLCEATDCGYRLRWDEVFLKPASKIGDVADQRIKECLANSTSISIPLTRPGDTLLINNWRMLHGCRPERGWNSVWRIPGDMKLSFHAARSIG